MSKATKRKHVTREVLDEYVTPEENQVIVKIIGSRGNNLHEAETPSGDNFLISMPSKFRKNVWIKRGDYVIVDPIVEGNKVCGEIAHILYPQQIKNLKKEGLWPETFMKKPLDQNGYHEVNDEQANQEKPDQNSSSDSDTDEEDLFVNPNHMQSLVIQSDDSTDEEIIKSGEEDSDYIENDNVGIKTIIDNNNIKN